MISTPMNDSIELHYQPVVDCSGQPVALEALMRWHHRSRGPISPETFIPIFEANGMIVELSRWALRQACWAAVSWTRPLGVSVNLSPVQFQQDDIVGLVTAVLAETNLAPLRLELEITDKPLLNDPDGSLRLIERLSDTGVRIAFEDFGLSAIQPGRIAAYPFSKLKIDTSFVLSIETSTSARWIIKTIIEFGHSYNMTVAAEGVETETQFAFLRDFGCDLMQGFLLGRPAPLETFAAITGHSDAFHARFPGRRFDNLPRYQQEPAHAHGTP